MASQGSPQRRKTSSVDDIFVIFNNKGGVGKTTLNFHLITRFASSHPDTDVLVIDMCPQANLSMTLMTRVSDAVKGLGGAEKFPGEKHVLHIWDNPAQELKVDAYPKTITGFVEMGMADGWRSAKEAFAESGFFNVTRDAPADPGDGRSYRSNVPGNIQLLCGDYRLQEQSGRITSAADQQGAGIVNYWKNVMLSVRGLVEIYAKKHGRSTVAFIDTNPAIAAYTKIAICSATKLLVPVFADAYSLEAVKSVLYSIYGIPRCSNMGLWSTATLYHEAKGNDVQMPILHRFILNRTKGQNKRLYRAAEENVRILLEYAYRAWRGEHGERIYGNEDILGYPTATKVGSTTWFRQTKLLKMRDLGVEGMKATAYGIPVYLLHRESGPGKILSANGLAVRRPALHDVEDEILPQGNQTASKRDPPALPWPEHGRDGYDRIWGDNTSSKSARKFRSILLHLENIVGACCTPPRYWRFQTIAANPDMMNSAMLEEDGVAGSQGEGAAAQGN